jgi:hypothetical protein
MRLCSCIHCIRKSCAEQSHCAGSTLVTVEINARPTYLRPYQTLSHTQTHAHSPSYLMQHDEHRSCASSSELRSPSYLRPYDTSALKEAVGDQRLKPPRLASSAYVSIRQHTSADLSIRRRPAPQTSASCPRRLLGTGRAAPSISCP